MKGKRSFCFLLSVFTLLLLLPAQSVSASTEQPSSATYLAGDRLPSGSLIQQLYSTIKPQLKNIADGNRASTSYVFVESELPQLSWTRAQLGLTVVLDKNDDFTQQASEVLRQRVFQEVQLDRLVNCLLADCPYELYWYDKSVGNGIKLRYNYTYDGTYIWITKLTLSFTPLSAYTGSSAYTVDTDKTRATQSAIAYAKAIVQANRNKTDLEKLEAYRAAICDLVSYNTDAANTAVFSDAWQLTYVFDQNPSTNVVCEGYSKAFQFLCSLSSFSGKVFCYSVCGTMSGGTGEGNHMWNVVSVNGKNYLADITNCDAENIGAPQKLFLKGVIGTENGRVHSIQCGSTTVTFTYREDQADLFCDGYLKLADTSLSVAVQTVPTITVPSSTTATTTLHTSATTLPTTTDETTSLTAGSSVLEATEFSDLSDTSKPNRFSALFLGGGITLILIVGALLIKRYTLG